jgi:hypothetical protein
MIASPVSVATMPRGMSLPGSVAGSAITKGTCMVLRTLPQAAKSKATFAGGAGRFLDDGSPSMTRSAARERWRPFTHQESCTLIPGEAFAPMGYDCRGESGSFALKRRTSGNLAVEVRLDVGTWSDAVAAFMKVVGLVDGQGFKATLLLPVSPRASPGQVPIGSPERWRQIVDNLAALVAALDHSFVPEIEAISGPSPEWFRPDSA